MILRISKENSGRKKNINEEIFDRWADEIDDLDEGFMEDEDYEPDEYYSD